MDLRRREADRAGALWSEPIAFGTRIARFSCRRNARRGCDGIAVHRGQGGPTAWTLCPGVFAGPRIRSALACALQLTYRERQMTNTQRTKMTRNNTAVLLIDHQVG